MPYAGPPRSAAARVPVLVPGHCWPMPPKEMLKCSKAGLAQSLWGLWVLVCTRFCLSPLSISGRYGVLILNVISPLLPSCWGFSFALGHGLYFFGGIQHSPVDGCSATSCNFGVLTGEGKCTSFYSAIFILFSDILKFLVTNANSWVTPRFSQF